MKKLLLTSVVLLPTVAWAHAGAHGLSHWAAGLSHPFSGLDHLLALLATGIWLAQTDTKPKLGFIVGFALILALAMAIGAQFNEVNLEDGIVATLVVLGALLACAVRSSIGARAAIVAATAAIHGFVHGTELPVGATAGLFAAALSFSSMVIVGSALILGMWSQGYIKALAARVVGALIMLVGIGLAL